MRLYRIYNHENVEVAVIKEVPPFKFELVSIIDKKEERPEMLQSDDIKSLTPGIILMFLKTRIDADWEYRKTHKDDTDAIANLIKKNNGRIYYDDFYIMVEEVQNLNNLQN